MKAHYFARTIATLAGLTLISLTTKVNLVRATPSLNDLMCVVSTREGECIVWYDPDTRKFYNSLGQEVPPPQGNQ